MPRRRLRKREAGALFYSKCQRTLPVGKIRLWPFCDWVLLEYSRTHSLDNCGCHHAIKRSWEVVIKIVCPRKSHTADLCSKGHLFGETRGEGMWLLRHVGLLQDAPPLGCPRPWNPARSLDIKVYQASLFGASSSHSTASEPSLGCLRGLLNHKGLSRGDHVIDRSKPGHFEN